MQGNCRSGSMIRTSGALSQTAGCAGEQFLIDLASPADGEFQYLFEQIEPSGRVSGSGSLVWKRDSSLPSTPVIQSPASPAHTAESNLTLEGTCTPGHVVELSGESSSALNCQTGRFSFLIQKQADGVYPFTVRQRNAAGTVSGASDFLWFRDTHAPPVATIDHPTQTPSVSRSAALTLSGSCETGNVVSLRGAEIAETTCVGAAFSFQVNRTVDGTFDFEIFQTDRAGNRSPSIQHTWSHDSTLPPAPRITSPSHPFLSNQGVISLNGQCEPGAVVMMTGSASLLSGCSAGTFQFNLTPGSDGTHSYSITQSDAAGNVSEEALFVWTRDTVAPAAPQILSPSTSPHRSAAGSIEISGTCETGATVALSGQATGSVTCTTQSFTFTVNQANDGNYSFSISQTDAAGNGSPLVHFVWNRDSSVPPEPILLNPANRNLVTNQNSLSISGTCAPGTSVELNGTTSLSQPCTTGTFVFDIQKGMDGSYPFSLRQISGSGVPSTAVALNWTRDTVSPGLPVLTSPSQTELVTSGDSILISGTCESGSTVTLTGDSLHSTSCASGSFGHLVEKTTDGTYSFLVSQIDLAGNGSGQVSVLWKRDSTPPESLVIATPSGNPFVSGNDQVTVSGTCEPNLRILISDETTGSLSESSCSPIGSFQVVFQKTADGTYPFRMLQKDLAENLSPITDFTWTRDTSIPLSPNLTPVTSPTHTNGTSIVISASCDASISPLPSIIRVSGDVEPSEILNPPQATWTECVNGSASFEVRKSSDGSFQFFFTQENPNTSFSSSPTQFVWNRDTQAPAKPEIISPSVHPITAPGSLQLTGVCEPLATVRIQGASQVSTVCTMNSTFSAWVEKTEDGTYDFSIDQTDSAGNTSPAALLRWIRNSNAISPPTILSPASNPTLSNEGQLSVNGSCLSGYEVRLSGATVSQKLCVNNSFNFLISASTDGTREYAITQGINGISSGPVTLQWTRDTVAPTIQIITAPPTNQIERTSQFVFTASETDVLFQCKVDQGSFQTCSSPFNLASIPNGVHTFTVQATDTAGNTGPGISRAWTQNSFNTIALYRFGSGAPLKDSSLYSSLGASYDQSLTGSTSVPPVLDTTGKLPASAPTSLKSSSSTQFFAPGNSVLNTLGRKTLTIEGFVKLSTLINSQNNYYTLISKSGSVAPEFGWEVRLRRTNKSNQYVLDFVGSLNGTSPGTVVSSNPIQISNTSTWNYFAVTWNQGSVSFYFGSNSATSRGSKTIGPVGSAILAATNAPLRIGFGANSSTNGTARFLAGSVDEIRVSQMVRPSLTLPLNEFAPD